MTKGTILYLFSVILLTLSIWRYLPMYPQEKTVADFIALFPASVEEIKTRLQKTKQEAQVLIEGIYAIPAEQRTFVNTLLPLDTALGVLSSGGAINNAIVLTHPDEAMRTSALEALNELSSYGIELIDQNKQTYQAVKEYQEVSAEKRTPEEQYALDETLRQYHKNGLEKSEDIQKQLTALKKELTELENEFEKTIATDNKKLTVTPEDLVGVDPVFVARLSKDETGKLILTVDYPTLAAVLPYCSKESTRKALWELKVNRAYPKNNTLMKKIIALRSQLAQLLDYPSFAQYDIDGQMAETPERVTQFLNEINKKLTTKYQEEIERYKHAIPEGVTLTADKKFKPWDIAFIKTSYRKKKFDLDNRLIAEYFPLERTISQLMHLYEDFFDIQLVSIPEAQLYHPDIRVIRVEEKNGNLLGYLALDLFPRPNKHTHACFQAIKSPLKLSNGLKRPGSGIVIANFTKPTHERPSLLRHGEVITFFHEFGHALHCLFNETYLEATASTHVKEDFVEMPSQMLEEWMWQPIIIKNMSKHYHTGKPLPDELIEKMVQLKNLDVGTEILYQVIAAKLSLEYFSIPVPSDLAAVSHRLQAQCMPDIAVMPEEHFEASFGHLAQPNYASKYYGYLWSKVYALDLFDYLKHHGLTSTMGTHYARTVLARGASRPPQELVSEFLGREPNMEAFYKDLGIGLV